MCDIKKGSWKKKYGTLKKKNPIKIMRLVFFLFIYGSSWINELYQLEKEIEWKKKYDELLGNFFSVNRCQLKIYALNRWVEREKKKSIACIGKHPLGNYIVVVHLLSKMNLHGFLIASQSKLNSIAWNMNQYDLFATRLLYSAECDYVESNEMKSVAKCTTKWMKCKR